MKTRLILDTSSEHMILGIAQGKTLLASHLGLHANQLSQLLMPTLETLLEQSGVNLDQIDEIAYGLGPGSYTGTRVGVAIAKSLHFGLKMNNAAPLLKGFCSLIAFIPQDEGSFACVMPSKAGNFYLCQGSRSCSSVTLQFCDLAEKETVLQALNSSKILIGKPFSETSALFSDYSFTPLCPNFESILCYLETEQAAPSPLELIYLHKP